MMSKSISHLNNQLQLLQYEYKYEKEEYEVKSAKMSIAQKIRRGICWTPIFVVKSYYNSLNQFVVEIKRNEDVDIEHHFEFGASLMFFNSDFSGKIEQFKFSGTVSYASNDRMVIIINNPSYVPVLEGAYQLGVQISFNEQNYQQMFKVLEEVKNAHDNRLSELREILLGNTEAVFRNISPVNFPWINKSQEETVNKVLSAKDVAIVHGPPGTGKTTTLVEAVYEVLSRETQVLVCAQSNMAVDWISEKLVSRGIPVLRIGNPTRITDNMLSFTYEYKFQAHPQYNELWSIRKTIRQIQKARKTNYKYRDKLRDQINKLKDRASDLQAQIHNSLISSTRVIASTLSSSNNKELEGLHFSTLFIDEAAQALEAASWLAIKKADRVIFAGDHCQLAPVVKSPKALYYGLETTLMEYIVNTKPNFVSLLLTQYRMNEAIMEFPSHWFYGGKLIADESVKDRNILSLDSPLDWIDTAEENTEDSFEEEFIGASFGRINKGEAKLLMKYLVQYVNKIGVNRILDENIDFGIISPYMNQVQLLSKMINKSESLNAIRKRIMVHTVDGFQGQERDVIFISLVRANDQGNIGFLKNLRRMNVAMTRARMKLVIIGNSKTLAKNEFYKELIRVCKSRK